MDNRIKSDEIASAVQSLMLPDTQSPAAGTTTVEAPKINLIINSLVCIDGRECVVERRLRDKWHFLEPKTNEPSCLSDVEIANLQAKGRFFVVWQPGDRDDISAPQEPLNVGENSHRENMRKLEYVEACVRHPDYCRSRRVLEPIIAHVHARRAADEEGAEDAPSFQTALNWIDKYTRYFPVYGPASFSVRHDKKGNYGARLPEYQERAIRVGIDIWLKRNSKTNAYASVHDFVRKYDAQYGSVIDKSALDARYLDENGRLKPPCLRTFERRCDRVDPAIRDAMRVGLRYAKERYRTFTTTALPDRPYSHIEVDHCTLDIILVHPGGTWLGRPDVITFRDRATTMIVGVGLGYEEPSYASFVSGLRNAMYPKDMSKFPLVKNGWPSYGRIENLYHDNAFHLIGDNIKEAARHLGMNLVRLQPREPWLKGALEKFFKDLNLGLVHNLPGTTLGNVLARRDHEHLGDAALTIEHFEHLLNFWICDIYNAGNRRALGHIRGFGGQSPLQAWAAKVRDFETDSLPKPETFIALAGDTEHRTIQKNGITIDHIIYENPILAKLLGNPKHKQKSIHAGPSSYKVVRDPSDLGRVYVADHHTGNVITVPATTAHLDYARGLTLAEHNVICANARALSRQKNKLPIDALMHAKAILNEIAAKITKAPKFKTIQRRLARWLEGDRLRQIRSEVRSFATTGSDYLALPPPISSDVTQPIGEEAPEVTPAATRSGATPVTSSPVETNSSNPDEDDLAEVRNQQNWKSGYVS